MLEVCGALKRRVTVQDYLDNVLSDVHELIARFDDVTDRLAQNPTSARLAGEYDYLLSKLDAVDAWMMSIRVHETLAGLGLSQLVGNEEDCEVGTLSLGQKVRLELAGIVVSRPAILILDEPTNHLDDDAVDYLISELRKWKGPVLMASHDRAFIEAVSSVIYDLDTASWQALVTAGGGTNLPGIYRCAGNYNDYLAAKQRAQAEHHRVHAAQQDVKRHLKAHRRCSEDIARGGVKLARAEGMARKFFADRAAATSVRRTRNDDRRFEDLARREVRKPHDHSLKLNLPEVSLSSGLAVTVRSTAVSGRLAPVTFDLAVGEHLLLTGPNGAGKSTLLQWMATGQPPRDGVGEIGVHARLGFVSQHLPTIDTLGIGWKAGIGERGAGVLHPSMWNTPISELSDGNQRRVQIALAVSQAPQMLIMDEPTNYLDLATIEELENTLEKWNGTLVVASHDRWLIDHWEGLRLDLQPVSIGGGPRP